ncbi:beta-1,3-galactosyltransferase 1-like isoform X1 [Diaphorina citri]|uniref:Hexosyltransferase n=1 Tax=Diaphorina citri TaxID=121845 RepID=A0A3Q0J2J2_DIACI|nr:beta-1,3-galactosyltransferase 1-like isoform X1 [Diaphorina citri]
MTLVPTYSKFLLGTLISITFIYLLYLPIAQHQPGMYPRSLHVKGWELSKSRNTSLYVRPQTETVLMCGALVCPPTPLTLLIVVSSAVGNFSMRRAVRETWAKELPSQTAVIFFIGRTENQTLVELVDEEQANYQDLVQEDFVDSYNNLTIASIMMLKFITHRCTHAQYIAKTDDDIYFNVHKLYSILTSPKFKREKVVLAGFLIRKGRVIRTPTEKWYTPEYMFSGDVYPDYLSGIAYIMSFKVARALYNVSLQLPLLHHEDVFITGICAKAAGIKPRYLLGVSNRMHYFDICNASWYIVVHRYTPEQLLRLWKPITEQRCNLTLSS